METNVWRVGQRSVARPVAGIELTEKRRFRSKELSRFPASYWLKILHRTEHSIAWSHDSQFVKLSSPLIRTHIPSMKRSLYKANNYRGRIQEVGEFKLIPDK